MVDGAHDVCDIRSHTGAEIWFSFDDIPALSHTLLLYYSLSNTAYTTTADEIWLYIPLCNGIDMKAIIRNIW